MIKRAGKKKTRWKEETCGKEENTQERRKQAGKKKIGGKYFRRQESICDRGSASFLYLSELRILFIYDYIFVQLFRKIFC